MTKIKNYVQYIIILLLFLFVSLLLIFTKSTAAPLYADWEEGYSTDLMDIQYPVTYNQSEARKMLEYVNLFRTGNDVDGDLPSLKNKDGSLDYLDLRESLTWDYGLEKIAMQRAAQAAIFYSHKTPTGWSGSSVALQLYPEGTFAIGAENLGSIANPFTAYHMFVEFRETNRDFGWQGHRGNMLNEYAKYVGISSCFLDGLNYWIMVFSDKPSPDVNNYTEPCDIEQTVTVTIGKDKIRSQTPIASIDNYELVVGETASLPKPGIRVQLIPEECGWPEHKVYPVDWNNPNYRIEDTSIAEIQNGKIIAKSVGTTDLIIEVADQIIRVPIEVLVYAEDLTFTQDTYTVSMNETLNLYELVTVLPSDTTHKEIQWSIPWPNTNHATISEDGIYTPNPLFPNEDVQVKATTAKGEVSQTFTIHHYWNDVKNGKVQADKNVYSLITGDTAQLSVTLTPRFEDEPLSLPGGTWSSDDETAVTVNNDGTLTATGVGTTWVYFNTRYINRLYNEPFRYGIRVTVLHDLTDNPDIPATCSEPGVHAPYRCTECGKTFVSEENARKNISGYETIWTLPHTPDTPIIENEVASECTVCGSYETVIYCSICGQEISREQTQRPVLGHDWTVSRWNWADDNSSVTVDLVCTRKVSHTLTLIANITRTSIKEATTEEEGEMLLTASLTIGGKTFTDSKTIITEKLTPQYVHVTSLSLDKSAASVSPLKSVVLTATAKSNLATNRRIIWSIEPSDVVTITVSGDVHQYCTVKYLKEGEATITATTEDGGFQKTCVVTSQKESVTGILFTNYATSIREGTQAKFETQTQPNSKLNGEWVTDTRVTWESSDDIIATVNTDGIVTGHKKGSVTITARSVSNPDVTVSRTLTVVGGIYFVPYKAPTCTEDGNIECYQDSESGWYCEDAEGNNYLLSSQVKLPATGHAYSDSEDIVVIPATCTETGVAERTSICRHCQDVQSETITLPIIDHVSGTPIETNRIPATCKKSGSKTLTTYCEICGKKLSETEEIISKTDHLPVTQLKENTAATCMEDGQQCMVTYCSECGEELDRSYQTSSPSTGHNWEVVSWDWNNDEVTLSLECLNDERHTQTLRANITQTVTKEATTEETGVRVLTAKVIYENHTWVDEQERIIPKLEPPTEPEQPIEPEEPEQPELPVEPTEPEVPPVVEPEDESIDITSATISSIKNMVYTGKVLTPIPKVVLNGVTLQYKKDFTISYKNNIKAGTAIVNITGCGNYVGTVQTKFTITKAPNRISKAVTSKKLKAKTLKKKSSSVKIGGAAYENTKKTYKLISVSKKAKKFIKVNKNGVITVKKGLKRGTYTVKVDIILQPTTNYQKTTITHTVKIIVK